MADKSRRGGSLPTAPARPSRDKLADLNKRLHVGTPQRVPMNVEEARMQYLAWKTRTDPSMRRIWFPVQVFVLEEVTEFTRWVQEIAVVGIDPRDGQEFPPEVRQAAAHVLVRLVSSHAVS